MIAGVYKRNGRADCIQVRVSECPNASLRVQVQRTDLRDVHPLAICAYGALALSNRLSIRQRFRLTGDTYFSQSPTLLLDI